MILVAENLTIRGIYGEEQRTRSAHQISNSEYGAVPSSIIKCTGVEVIDKPGEIPARRLVCVHIANQQWW